MNKDKHICPNCGEIMVPAVAALNRGLVNALFCGFGSSVLQIRSKKGRWLTFMKPSRSAKASYCKSCGSLLVAPSLADHRRELDIE